MHIIIQIVLAYTLAGLPAMIALQLTMAAVRREPIREYVNGKTLLFVALTYLFWPWYAWQVFYTVIINASKCVHCGQTVQGKDAIKHHIYVCEKNPVVQELNAARKVCQWVDAELGSENNPDSDWNEAGNLMIEWIKARG
jgi:hypothetical protein